MFIFHFISFARDDMCYVRAGVWSEEAADVCHTWVEPGPGSHHMSLPGIDHLMITVM